MKTENMTNREMQEGKLTKGTLMASKAEPGTTLIINDSIDSVYYCVRVGDRTGRELPYLRQELQPAERKFSSTKKQLSR